MDFIKYRFIYYPLLFITGVFILDKIFLLPEVRDNFMQPGGAMYYSQRIAQLKKLEDFLEKENAGRKIGVVMGDSRSFAIGNVPAWYVGKKDWYLFNFAGPQAVPAYHYFLAEKIFSKHKRPKYLIIGLSPDGFNKNTSFFSSPVMSMGMDERFIERNKDHILNRDLEAYYATRRYALVGMQFSLKEFIYRISATFGLSFSEKNEGIPIHMMPIVSNFIDSAYIGNEKDKREFIKSFLSSPENNWDQYVLSDSPRVKMLDLADGANYQWFGTMGFTKLKNETETLVKLYLKYYEVSDAQLYFFQKTVELARRSGAEVIVFWPRANPYMINVYKNEERIYKLWDQIVKITEKEGAHAVDLNRNPATSCSNFYDASHLSIVCYPSITKALLNTLESR